MIIRAQLPNEPYSDLGTSWFGGPAAPVGLMRKVRPRLRGLGDCLTQGQIEQQIGGMQNCDPKDSVCVMRNGQIAMAAIDAIVSSAGNCVPPGTPLSFVPDTSPNALNAFMNNAAVAPPVMVGGAMVAQTPAGGLSVTPLSPAPPPSTIVNPSPGSQTTGSTTVKASTSSALSQSNGTTTAGTAGLVSTVQGWVQDVSTGKELISGVSNWVLVGGAVVAVLFLLKGGHR